MHNNWPEWTLDDPPASVPAAPASPAGPAVSVATASVSEYDRFGPWIDEVVGPEDVPRLYRTYPIDFASTRLVLKVPRNISRRNATASMDLYDYLVIMDDTWLTLLSRRVGPAMSVERLAGDPGFDAVTIAVADVVAIEEKVNLLDGRLTVSTSAGTAISVPFNGSARSTVTRLVDLLRTATCHKAATSAATAILIAGKVVGGSPAVLDRASVEPFLFSRFQELREGNPALVPLATHGTGVLSPLASSVQGLARRITHAASPMTLHGALIAADAGALEIVGRHEFLLRGRASVYSSSRLVVPWGVLDQVELAPHPLYAAATIVTLTAGLWSTRIAVPSDSVAERLLRAAASPAHQ